MSTRINYITGRTSEFNQIKESIPIHLESGGFLLCTSGSGEVVVNSKQYSIKPWSIVVAFPHSYVYAIHTSEDFDGVIFGVEMDLLINVEIPNRSYYITSITENPCVAISEEEARRILQLRESFLMESQKKEHPLRSEIDEAILKIIIYEVAALYRHATPNVESQRSRDDAIFNEFVVRLHSEESLHRDLEYFAMSQSITPAHLSKVVKRVSSRTASEWISNYTIISIKRLLQSKSLPIATIAEMLNFPNASFLAQYFKQRTTQTPKQYRTEFFQGV